MNQIGPVDQKDEPRRVCRLLGPLASFIRFATSWCTATASSTLQMLRVLNGVTKEALADSTRNKPKALEHWLRGSWKLDVSCGFHFP